MRSNKLLGLALFISSAGLLAGTSASAHHSSAMFDHQKEVAIQGTIKEIQWTNPHAWIEVTAKNSAGKATLWSFETEGPNMLYRAGITRKNLKVGDTVTVKGHPLKDGRPGASLISIAKPNGAVLSLMKNLRKPPRGGSAG